MRRVTRIAFAGPLLLALAGCKGNTADLGGPPEDGGHTPDGEATEADGGVGGDGAATSNPLSGTYSGYIESFTFPDGSDTVAMTLTFAAGGAVTGTVRFGTAALLPPPTDPDVGYPPGYGSPGSPQTPYEGFDFTARGGTYAAPPRVQLAVATPEIWQKWCDLQTTTYPQYDSETDGGCGTLLGYGCLPNVATMGGTSGCSWTSCDHPTPTPVDCGKLALCGMQLCQCTATGCDLPIGNSGDVAFDMRLTAGALDGTVVGLGSGAPLNVYLTRQ
jgi:hypothetical protein